MRDTKISLIRELRAVERELQSISTQDMWGPSRPDVGSLMRRRETLRGELWDRNYLP